LPIDITCSDWLCTLEKEADSTLALRLGFRYVKGLSQQSGQAIVRERAVCEFLSIDDLRNRVPELRKDELRKLAAVGALNFIQNSSRRDALWQVERVTRDAGELYEELLEQDGNSPLQQMTIMERVDADFRGTGLTIGKHPVAYYRGELKKLKALRAIDIRKLRDGTFVRVAGWVIVRQRPGTAKGFMFLSLEDETGVSNIIVTPQLFDKYRLELVNNPFLLIEGALQNQDNVISVKANHVQPLSFKAAAAPSHDFH
jgi:error-prone DNA polymerase